MTQVRSARIHGSGNETYVNLYADGTFLGPTAFVSPAQARSLAYRFRKDGVLPRSFRSVH